MELGTELFIIPSVPMSHALACCHIEAGRTPYQHESIYRLYNRSGRLLYVGITFNISSRWPKHRRKKAWWGEVRWARVTCFQGEGIARQYEIAAIRGENPLYNIARPKAVS